MSRMHSLLICLIVLSCSHVRAGMDLPNDLERMENYNRLKQQARMQRQALIFLKVNPGNTQDFVEEAVEDYVRRFKRYGPVILVPLHVDTPGVPDTALEAFENLGGIYPQLVVVDPDDYTVITKVPYLAQDDREDEIRDYRREVHRYLRDKQRRPRVVPTPKALW